MFRRSPSKQGILDQAGVFPEQLEETKENILKATKKVASLPEPYVLLRAKVNKHRSTSRHSVFTNDISTNSEEDEAILPKTFHKCLRAFILLDNAFRDFYNLANKKLQVKLDAPIRKAMIRTGNVKKKVDKLLSDEELKNLATKLESAYLKLERVSAVVIMSFISDSYPFDETYSNWGKFLLVHKALSASMYDHDVDSKWLREIMGHLFPVKKRVDKHYREFLREAELIYDKPFSDKEEDVKSSLRRNK